MDVDVDMIFGASTSDQLPRPCEHEPRCLPDGHAPRTIGTLPTRSMRTCHIDAAHGTSRGSHEQHLGCRLSRSCHLWWASCPFPVIGPSGDPDSSVPAALRPTQCSSHPISRTLYPRICSSQLRGECGRVHAQHVLCGSVPGLSVQLGAFRRVRAGRTRGS